MIDHVIGLDLVDHLRDVTRGKRVLDVGDEESPFLAELLATEARAWMVVGRNAPCFSATFSPSLIVNNAKFDARTFHLRPTDFDLILFSNPSFRSTQDAACLQWTVPGQVIAFLSDSQDGTTAGSPEFWGLAAKLTLEKEWRSESGFLLIFRKLPPSASEVEIPSRSLPKINERYRLAPTAQWPGKRHGEDAPVVIVLRDWTDQFGPVRLIKSEAVLHIRLYELGSQL